MSHIKAIITDIDGVMVGKQEGVNFPLPHQDVINALENISANGISIVLCTAKFGYAIKDIAIQAKLANSHITDGGALIIDWLNDKIIAKYILDKQIVRDYVQACLKQNIYTELYTDDNYYIQDSQSCDFTAKRSKVTQMDSQVVESLVDFAKQHDIIKIISFSDGKADMAKLDKNVRNFSKRLNYIWSHHPYLMPRQNLVMTALEVSKQHAAQEVVDYLGVNFDNILGIGDSESDWSFMQLCGYVATIGTDGAQLQELSKSKGEGRYYFASSVDDHGMIEALKHFKLLN